jgi:dephospho-CoA kinase
MKALITGRSGSGKSTIFRELQRNGYPAVDTDKVPGMYSWVSAQTGQPVQVDYSKPIDLTATLWVWDRSVLRTLVGDTTDIFVCGGANNDLDFGDIFDVVFVLTLPPETQRQRILARTEHDYGKLPAMQEQILAEQAELVEHAERCGAVMLDATRTPEQIVREILEHAHER